MNTPAKPHLLLPEGTHVVTRAEGRHGIDGKLYPAGTVGVVAEAPLDETHSYLIRLPDGSELRLKRHELRIRKNLHRNDLEDLGASVLEDYQLQDCVIYRCVTGSRAYGLAGEDSDTDRRGIYLPPAELHWSLYGVPEQLEAPEEEECFWEIQKFLVLALKANPNILECLYTPLVEYATPLAEELRGMREIFLSKYVYQTYSGYVMSQFKKMEQDLRAHGKIKWKHAMHLIRLLHEGVTILREGFLSVSVEPIRERLLGVRRGESNWGDVNEWRLRLHREFDQAFAETRLPERPDFEAANRFLIKARRQAADAKP